MTTTIIEITADSSEDVSYHVQGTHLHMLQVFVYGWRDDGYKNSLIQWLNETDWPATLDRGTTVVYAPSEDGSYLVDEKATTTALQAAFPGAEIRWTIADQPSRDTIERTKDLGRGEPPFLIDLCVHRECDSPDCILVGGRPATARLRRRADHAWHRAGKGDTPAERYVERRRDDQILTRADTLDPDDHSLDAEQIRQVAESIRDHREMDARRAAWARQDAIG